MGGFSFLPIGGSASKTDRKYQLEGFGDLSSLFYTGKNEGKAAFSAGEKDLTNASNFFNSILSGDMSKISQVLAPEIAGIKGRAGQEIAGVNQFQGRSGGSAAEVESINAGTEAEINNMIASLVPTAAADLANIGATQTGAGLGAENLAEGAASALTGHAQEARSTDIQQGNLLGGGVASLLGSVLEGLQGGGGASDVLSSVIGGLVA